MSAVGSNSDGSRLIVAGSLPASGMSIASAEPPSLPCAGRRARRTDHPSPHTVVAGARSPARRPPVSHLPCTHSFRTNGGHTDARIHRLSTAGAGCIGVSGTASGNADCDRLCRRMEGSAQGRASGDQPRRVRDCLLAVDPVAARSLPIFDGIRATSSST